LTNSTREYCDSEAVDRLGAFRLPGAIYLLYTLGIYSQGIVTVMSDP